MKILVMEDDKKLAALVRKGLEARGFAIDFCDNGDDAYALATTRAYDALVLDIMVPGRDGLSILRNLRDRRVATPVERGLAISAGILLLTADFTLAAVGAGLAVVGLALHARRAA